MELVTSKGTSSSLFTHQSKKFNVFLSFTGIDTRRGFTSHLYHALCQQGIDTFIDNDLKKGDKISDVLINIIENSTMSIIIFSENYASSTWCLDELAKIVECRNKNNQIVQPVFYMVEPSYVRYQREKFEEALTKHEQRFKNSVQRWRDALHEAAGYSGWHFKVNDSF
ncbi:TMV resistance protein N-like [Quercus lobata]|uniref:ADP-ribosyl cyclase/cyclic ADP-ribose hydrolase n=1 Tax=Quercus lobata TaxID=97700 RepID=A0A7N2LYG8_QUELO|nr:TMV resistance protein N-like [Quercus lobata]